MCRLEASDAAALVDHVARDLITFAQEPVASVRA
jgi:hypothetical protein